MFFDALSSLFGDRIMMVRLLTFALKHVLRLAGRIAKALGRRLPDSCNRGDPYRRDNLTKYSWRTSRWTADANARGECPRLTVMSLVALPIKR
jgi:hypothetical protein